MSRSTAGSAGACAAEDAAIRLKAATSVNILVKRHSGWKQTLPYERIRRNRLLKLVTASVRPAGAAARWGQRMRGQMVQAGPIGVT